MKTTHDIYNYSNQIIDQYTSGVSIENIVAQVPFHRGRVVSLLNTLGYATYVKTRALRPIKKELMRVHQAGMSLCDMSKQYHTSINTLIHIMEPYCSQYVTTASAPVAQKRKADTLALRSQGASITTIADKLGISMARVYQIIMDHENH